MEGHSQADRIFTKVQWPLIAICCGQVEHDRDKNHDSTSSRKNGNLRNIFWAFLNEDRDNRRFGKIRGGIADAAFLCWA
jgi:hypothetical protein